MSKTVGLLINETKPAAVAAAQELAARLKSRGVSVLTQDTIATLLDKRSCEGVPERGDVAEQSDFLVVFGGDGTLLSACRVVAPYDTPILAVHLGHFGFLTQVAPEGLWDAVDRVLADDCPLEERGMLQAEIQRAGTSKVDECDTYLGMNDVVVASGAVRLVYVRTQIGGEFLATYAADGVIVASPTGSTGYSLSAGGPLVHPSAPVFVVAPICPHTLAARPLIIPNTETVELVMEQYREDTKGIVSIDGQIEVAIAPNDIVRVSRSAHTIKFLQPGNAPTFFEKIRSRWNYGERSNGG